jgi:hypothetical protein
MTYQHIRQNTFNQWQGAIEILEDVSDGVPKEIIRENLKGIKHGF